MTGKISSSEDPRDACDEIFGHNTEVSVRGLTYHVQTENIFDQQSPVVSTLVYQDGSLIKKLTNSYRDLLGEPDFLQSLEQRVKSQHLQVLGQLKKGKLVSAAPSQ
jgi:hypothetical protein